MAHTAVLHSLDAEGVDDMVECLRELGGPVGETEAIDQIAALERLTSAAPAAQARVTATLHEERVAREAAAGLPAAEPHLGDVADQPVADGDAARDPEGDGLPLRPAGDAASGDGSVAVTHEVLQDLRHRPRCADGRGPTGG